MNSFLKYLVNAANDKKCYLMTPMKHIFAGYFLTSIVTNSNGSLCNNIQPDLRELRDLT